MLNDYRPNQDILSSWFLTGPTAGGKSAISLHLANLLNAEIISLDSMAVYRGMDIGTAKPSAEEQSQIPHHLVDVVNPDEDFSISAYLELAQAAVKDILRRGKVPLFVGGTPLYLKALIHGLDAGPSPNAQLRTELETRYDDDLDGLIEELRSIDPASASRIHRNDKRRIVRAVEFYRLSGRAMSDSQTHFKSEQKPEKLFVLEWPRDKLHARIENRVDKMMENGLLAEAEQVRNHWPKLSPTAIQAVGYAELFAYLDGEWELGFAIEKIKTRTRRFARRQETWFRGFDGARLLPLAEPVEAEKMAQQLIGHV
jgi:tRNA dimethylallyltransferase